MRPRPSWQILSHLFLWGLWTVLATKLECQPGWPTMWPIQSCFWGRILVLISAENHLPLPLWAGASLLQGSPPAVGQGRGTPKVSLHWLASVRCVLCFQGWWQKLLHCHVPLRATFWGWFFKSNLSSHPSWAGWFGFPNRASRQCSTQGPVLDNQLTGIYVYSFQITYGSQIILGWQNDSVIWCFPPVGS